VDRCALAGDPAVQAKSYPSVAQFGIVKNVVSNCLTRRATSGRMGYWVM
jgi:hypothetical protein